MNEAVSVVILVSYGEREQSGFETLIYDAVKMVSGARYMDLRAPGGCSTENIRVEPSAIPERDIYWFQNHSNLKSFLAHLVHTSTTARFAHPAP